LKDLLWGAGPIAKALFGRDTQKNRRKVYYGHQRRRLPIWKEGSEIITRKSLLQRHYSPPTATETK
jgi:hypothetical protein